jgi:hypothetical protein
MAVEGRGRELQDRAGYCRIVDTKSEIQSRRARREMEGREGGVGGELERERS